MTANRFACTRFIRVADRGGVRLVNPDRLSPVLTTRPTTSTPDAEGRRTIAAHRIARRHQKVDGGLRTKLKAKYADLWPDRPIALVAR